MSRQGLDDAAVREFINNVSDVQSVNQWEFALLRIIDYGRQVRPFAVAQIIFQSPNMMTPREANLAHEPHHHLLRQAV